jgi:hypothetical protein
MMKTTYVRFLSAFFALAALAAAGTRAQEVDQLLVNVPYAFVVSGKTLPAGTYRVNRINDRDLTQLEITGVENGASVLLVSGNVIPTQEDKPALRFEHIGDQYFLSRIETADHIFTIRVPAKAAPVVAMKKQTNPSPSSSSGSN